MDSIINENQIAIIQYRALASELFPAILPDRQAEHVLSAIAAGKMKESKDNRRRALENALWRFSMLDEVKDYCHRHQNAVIVEIGNGLSDLHQQFNSEGNLWINIDVHDNIIFRERYLPRSNTDKTIICNPGDMSWVKYVRPAERAGLLFLLSNTELGDEETANSYVSAIEEKFSDCSILVPGDDGHFVKPIKNRIADNIEITKKSLISDYSIPENMSLSDRIYISRKLSKNALYRIDLLK